MINTNGKSLEIGTIKISSRIFHGYALSPLWVCLALRLITTLINRKSKGYTLPEIGGQLSRLWYVDDLKLYTKTQNHLHDLIKCVAKYSYDIQIRFGLDKCKIICIEKGQWTDQEKIVARMHQGIIGRIREDELYKYFGYLQAREIDYKMVKNTTKDTYLLRERAILRTKL